MLPVIRWGCGDCADGGVRPWHDEGAFYSLVCFSLGALVITAISSEFLRGAAVIQRHTGQSLLASMVQLTRRNSRRYGGYIVHLGVVVMFIGFAGQAFNQNVEKELGVGDAINIGPYKLVSQSFTQDSNPNYDTEYSLLDVYRNGKKVTQLAPEKRFYQASQTPKQWWRTTRPWPGTFMWFTRGRIRIAAFRLSRCSSTRWSRGYGLVSLL